MILFDIPRHAHEWPRKDEGAKDKWKQTQPYKARMPLFRQFKRTTPSRVRAHITGLASGKEKRRNPGKRHIEEVQADNCTIATIDIAR